MGMNLTGSNIGITIVMTAATSRTCTRILIEIHHGTETSFPHFPSTKGYYENTLPKYLHRSRS